MCLQGGNHGRQLLAKFVIFGNVFLEIERFVHGFFTAHAFAKENSDASFCHDEMMGMVQTIERDSMQTSQQGESHVNGERTSTATATETNHCNAIYVNQHGSTSIYGVIPFNSMDIDKKPSFEVKINTRYGHFRWMEGVAVTAHHLSQPETLFSMHATTAL
jgi:hypothetical protein